VTLNITPPALDVQYVATDIWGRKLSMPTGIGNPWTAWTLVGNYIGVPATPGTVGVGGLENNQLYEFIVSARYLVGALDVYSAPSVAIRRVVSSSGQPATHRILLNVAAAVSSISVANGYNFDMRHVKIIRSAGQANLNEYPGAVIYESYQPDNTRIDTPLGTIRRSFRIVVEGWIADFEDPNTSLENLAADIEQAVLEDHSRGGDAITTLLTETFKVMDDGAAPILCAVLEFEIHNRTDYGNPYQSR
jgi:hypothetical protein